MVKINILVGAALAMTATAIVPAAPAMARDGYYAPAYYDDDYDDDRRYHDKRRYKGDSYYGKRYYRGDRYYDDRRHYGDRRSYYRGRRCDNGTGGTVIGAIVGGLLGNEVVGRRGDKTAGVIIGGVAGAIAGRAIDRSDRRC